MALNTLKNRVVQAQRKTNAGAHLELVAEAIARGAYYDELTENEKNAYCEYHGLDRDAMEEVNRYVLGNLHFEIERKPKSPTEKQLRERVEEVESIVYKMKEEYNTPEAKEERERRYLEMTRKGAKE